MKRLSKSRYTLFSQCPKAVWLRTYKPEMAEVDEAQQARFEKGNEVGDLATYNLVKCECVRVLGYQRMEYAASSLRGICSSVAVLRQSLMTSRTSSIIAAASRLSSM